MTFDFSTWWDALQLIQKIYWVIAFPSTLIFLIQLVLTFVGGDVDDFDTDIDTEIAGDHGFGGHIFAFKNLVAFFTIFAWAGLASIEGGLSTAVILIISTVSGLIMMFIMAALFYFMSKLTQSGTLQMENAVGATGTVYFSIPAHKEGMGKVQVTVQGGVRTLDAMTEDDEALKTGSIIEVVEVISDDILIVTRSR